MVNDCQQLSDKIMLPCSVTRYMSSVAVIVKFFCDVTSCGFVEIYWIEGQCERENSE